MNEDFFEDDTIQWIEEQENGKDYVIFYLKLCLKSLKDEGRLIRYVGERLMPYDVKALSKLTGTSPDTVAVAMKTFNDIGLVEMLETGELYMKQIQEMVGSETEVAKRVRKHRAKQSIENTQKSKLLQSNNEVTKCNTEKELEKELELELDKDNTNANTNANANANTDSNNESLDESYNDSQKADKKRASESELKERFNVIWKDYPNKKGKSKAFTSYKRAVKEGTTDEEIKKGLFNYRKEIDIKGTQKQFIKHGSTWFNNKGWEDDYDHTPNQQKNFGRSNHIEVVPDWLNDDFSVKEDSPPKPTEMDEELLKERMRRVLGDG